MPLNQGFGWCFHLSLRSTEMADASFRNNALSFLRPEAKSTAAVAAGNARCQGNQTVANARWKVNGRGLANVFRLAGHLANSCARPVALREHLIVQNEVVRVFQQPAPASVASELTALAGKLFHWLTIFESGDVVDGRSGDVQ